MTADLFDDDPAAPPIARRSDPTTSHDAAAKYTATNRQSHKDILRRLIAEYPGRTVNEYAEILQRRGFNPMTAHRIPNKRVSELLAEGFVSVGQIRQCRVSGHNCRTFVPGRASQ